MDVKWSSVFNIFHSGKIEDGNTGGPVSSSLQWILLAVS